jgi:predicted RND superfamily exporter protein
MFFLVSCFSLSDYSVFFINYYYFSNAIQCVQVVEEATQEAVGLPVQVRILSLNVTFFGYLLLSFQRNSVCPSD